MNESDRHRQMASRYAALPCSRPCANGGGSGRGPLTPAALQFFGDSLQDRLQVALNVLIGETQHPVMLLQHQPLRPLCIVICLLGVAVTVNLNHQFGLRAEEINDEAANWMLFPKSVAVDLFGSEPSPELPLRGCQFPAQFPGAALDEYRCPPAATYVASQRRESYVTM